MTINTEIRSMPEFVHQELRPGSWVSSAGKKFGGSEARVELLYLLV